jgi:diguanylate cyclase (GGDEF)-like protein
MLSITVLIIYKSPSHYLTFGISYLVFVIGMFVFLPDAAIRVSNLINGTIVFFISLAISKFVYDNFYGQVGKNLLLEAENEKLEFVSLHDPLTGLANRRNFDIQIGRELQLQKRYQHHSVLALVDLDHFRRVYDQFGYSAGDMVLQEIAQILRDDIRDADLASRWGGEEFLIFLSHNSLDGACMIVERIRDRIGQHTFSVRDDGVHITASFGIAPLFTDEHDTYLSSYHLADQAMYSAKTNGRNQIVVA